MPIINYSFYCLMDSNYKLRNVFDIITHNTQ